MKILFAGIMLAAGLSGCAVVPAGPPGAVYVAPTPRVAVVPPVVVVRPWYHAWYHAWYRQ